MTLLEVKNLRSGYHRIDILHEVSLSVSAGEAVALIGANGAGKTTLLCSISNLVNITGGLISFAGENVIGRPSYRIGKLGIAHVPQSRELFPRLTVRDNLLLGAYLRRDRDERKDLMDHALGLFPRLAERLGQYAGTMSGGEQQMLAIARGLMLGPRLMMLDEPSQGLAPRVVHEVYERLEAIHAEGTSILLVEQNVRAALQFASRAYVLERGRITLEGTSHELESNDEVRRAYLGV